LPPLFVVGQNGHTPILLEYGMAVSYYKLSNRIQSFSRIEHEYRR
jgi:hypothetical protein